MPRAPLAAAVLLLAVGTGRAGGDHEMLAAEQELKIDEGPPAGSRARLRGAPARGDRAHRPRPAGDPRGDPGLQGSRSRARAGAESDEEEAGALRGRRRLGPASMRDGERRPLPLLLGAVRPPGHERPQPLPRRRRFLREDLERGGRRRKAPSCARRTPRGSPSGARGGRRAGVCTEPAKRASTGRAPR